MITQSYLDGTTLTDLPADLAAFVQRNSLNDGATLKFVGLLGDKEQTWAILPKRHRQSELPETSFEDFRNCMECLSRFTRSGISAYNQPVSSDEDSQLRQFGGLKYLLQYFQQYGPYSKSTKTVGRGYNGQIHWQKTLSQSPALYLAKGASLPLIPYVNRRKAVVVSVIKAIQISFTRLSLKRIGRAILTQSEYRSIASRLSSHEVSEIEPSHALAIIERELRSNRKSVERRLLLVLKALLSEQSFGYDHDFKYGVRNFWVVWENLVQHALHKEFESVRASFPRMSFVKDSQAIHSESSLRPDLVATIKDKTIVIDAKYYDMAKSRPSWYDIVKQSFYNAVVSREVGPVQANYFVLPGELKNQLADQVFVVNKATEAEYDSTLFPHITCLYVPTDNLIKIGCGYLVKNELDNLIQNNLNQHFKP